MWKRKLGDDYDYVRRGPLQGTAIELVLNPEEQKHNDGLPF